VIDAYQIEQLELGAHAFNPPAKTVGAVVGDENGHVAEQLHAPLTGMGAQGLPLLKEQELDEDFLLHRLGFLFPGPLQGRRLPVPQGPWPVGPAAVGITPSQNPEQGIVLDPVAMPVTEILELLPGAGIGMVLKALPGAGKTGLAIGHVNIGRQPAPGNQIGKVDQIRIAGMGRKALIGRAVVMGRPQRQDLPDAGATIGEEVDEPPGLGAEFAMFARTGKRGGMQQNAGATTIQDGGVFRRLDHQSGFCPLRITPPMAGAPVPWVKVSER